MPNAIKAKKKPIQQVTPDALGVDVTPQIKTLEVNEPPKRQVGTKVASVEELVQRLRNEAKLL